VADTLDALVRWAIGAADRARLGLALADDDGAAAPGGERK
jgi:hypothetical protein